MVNVHLSGLGVQYARLFQRLKEQSYLQAAKPPISAKKVKPTDFFFIFQHYFVQLGFIVGVSVNKIGLLPQQMEVMWNKKIR